MSNSVGRIAGGLAGGIIGFFAGGPFGAAQGFALGFAIASYAFPPDFDENSTAKDEFEATTATEGTPVPVIFGRRRLPGNVIWFDYANLEVKEVTPDGKGKGFGKATDSEYGTFAYAPVTIGICLGPLTTLHGIYNQKNEDWQAENTNRGGSAIQMSSPPAEIDFGYGPKEGTTLEPKSSPLKGMTVAHSKFLFVGQNSRNMTPLDFDVEIGFSSEATSFLGSATAGMPAGCVNPAHIYYEIFTNKQWALGMDESWLDQAAWQAARQVYEDEGTGLAPKWNSLTTAKRMIADINFHCRSLIRPSLTGGTLELFPIRNRVADWTLPREHCSEENGSGRSWKKLYNIFTASFPDKDSDIPFTQRTINAKNEAAQDISGRRNPKSYNFPHITDRDTALWLLELLKRHDSYPLALLSVSVPQIYHEVRVGDVMSVTHPKFDFVSFDMRVEEVKHPEFAGMDIQLKLKQEIPTLDGQIAVPIDPQQDPPTPQPDPVPTLGVTHTEEHWRSRISGPPFTPPAFPPTGSPPRSPDKGGPIRAGDLDDETGYFGYPLIAAYARGKSSDVGFGFSLREDEEVNMPSNLEASTLVMGRGHLFTLDNDLDAGDWTPALPDQGIMMTKVSYGDNDVFDLPDQDGVDSDGIMALEISPYVMVIGNYEYCRWGRSLDLGQGKYSFELVMRCANKVRPLSWPAGTQVMIFKLRRPVVPDGLSDFLSWGHRPRHIDSWEWRNGRKLRMYVQTVSYAQKVQPLLEQTVITFDEIEAVDPTEVTGIVQPKAVLESNRAPTPAAQGIMLGSTRDTDRAWYPLTVTGSGNMEVQIQPFPSGDWDGIGDRIVAASEPIEPFGPEPYLPTDLADYDDYNTDVDGGRAFGVTYRLRIWEDLAAWATSATPLITMSVTTVENDPWPHFEVTESDLHTAGGTFGGSPMAVDVLTDSGMYGPPQFISKIGVWDTTGLGRDGGGGHSPMSEYPIAP